MVLAIEPLLVLAFERCFHGNDDEVLLWASLNANANHHLALGGTRLVFQEKIVHE
jgi:hypothetical protein